MLPDERCLDTIRGEGGRFVDLIRDGDPAQPVPSCPEFDLTALGRHLGRVWSWVAASLDAGEALERSAFENTTDEGPALAAWLTEQLDGLIDTLVAVGPDTPSWTFAGPQSARFWYRRQAHEASIHRWDAEHALGEAAPIPADVAVDGIDELLEFFVAIRDPSAFAGEGTLHFHATDTEGEWFVARTADGMEWEHGHRKGDVAARGTASDLLLFVWGRVPPERLEVFGDAALLAEWQRLVRF